MSEVASRQVEGLARQIEAGQVTHAVLFSTSNEWMNRPPFLVRTIYQSPDGGITDGSGVAISTRVDEVSGRIVEVMDRVAQAVLDSNSSGGGVAIMTPLNFVLHPGLIEALPDPVRRAYVSEAINEIHLAVSARATDINAAAGRTVVSVGRADEHLRAVWASADDRFVSAAGVRLDYRQDSVDGSPHFVAIAPTTGSAHMGTIGNGILARAFIDIANRLPGVAISQLSDAEIRSAAGVLSTP
jgi:hypothetical protein